MAGWLRSSAAGRRWLASTELSEVGAAVPEISAAIQRNTAAAKIPRCISGRRRAVQKVLRGGLREFSQKTPREQACAGSQQRDLSRPREKIRSGSRSG